MTTMTNRNRSTAPFILLCLLGFLAFFSSYLRIPVMPLYAASLGAAPAEVGSINGAFMLAAGLLSIPAGLLADRTGRKLPIIGGLLAIGISSLLIPFCHLTSNMITVYIFFGAGLAAFAPGMLSLVADTIQVDQLGKAYSWYTTAIYIAMTLGPASGGFLAKSLGMHKVFFVSGWLTIVVACLALILLPKSPTRHRNEIHTVLAATVSLLHNHYLGACLLATVGSCIGFGIFLTFLPLYATGRGSDPAQVGIIFAAQAFTNVICRVPIGRISDRFDRRWLVTTGLIFLAMALVAIGQAAKLTHLIICAVTLGTGMALIYTSVGALIAEQVPALQRGLAMGMYNSSIYLGMMTGSATMGIAVQRIGYSIGFSVAGGVAIIALFGFAVLTRSKHS